MIQTLRTIIIKLIINFFHTDKNNTLGFIRVFFATFGGLGVSYLLIMLISKQLTYTIFENIVIGIIILPIFWSLSAYYIVMSKTKFYAVLKTILPLSLLYTVLYIF